jgi:hypothetical protein
MSLNGKCLCESISYTIEGDARDVVDCHCSRCRRHTGHFMAATGVDADRLLISGEDRLRWYATADVEYAFCGNCGSTLFWRTSRRPGYVAVAAGTLTPPTGLKTIATIYTDYASDYHSFDESIPSYPEDRPDS